MFFENYRNFEKFSEPKRYFEKFRNILVNVFRDIFVAPIPESRMPQVSLLVDFHSAPALQELKNKPRLFVALV